MFSGNSLVSFKVQDKVLKKLKFIWGIQMVEVCTKYFLISINTTFRALNKHKQDCRPISDKIQ